MPLQLVWISLTTIHPARSKRAFMFAWILLSILKTICYQSENNNDRYEDVSVLCGEVCGFLLHGCGV